MKIVDLSHSGSLMCSPRTELSALRWEVVKAWVTARFPGLLVVKYCH